MYSPELRQFGTSLRVVFTAAGGTSGNTMAIVAAEPPEPSTHTKGAIVAQQNDGAMPSWFACFMQAHQNSTQDFSDKLSTVGQNQQRTLDLVSDMQVH